MPISVDATTYISNQEFMAAVLENYLRMLEGGQHVTRGTDIQMLGLAERGHAVIAQFEAAGARLNALTATLKENLGAPGAGLSRSAP